MSNQSNAFCVSCTYNITIVNNDLSKSKKGGYIYYEKQNLINAVSNCNGGNHVGWMR